MLSESTEVENEGLIVVQWLPALFAVKQGQCFLWVYLEAVILAVSDVVCSRKVSSF